MKLYEFNVRDNFNTPETVILVNAENSLREEAILQSWEEDYTFKQSKPVEITPAGERLYSFEVYGSYAKDVTSSEAVSKNEVGSSDDRRVARQPEL